MKKQALHYLVLLLTIFCGSQLHARPNFLEQWRILYPASTSGHRGCQLCHAKADGGEPWNAYGFEIRFNYITLYASQDIVASIREVELNNSDNDPENLSNISEINLNLDPGWAPGNVNSHIFKNGDVIRNQAPPFSENSNSELCIPVKSSGGTISLICV